MSTSTNVRAAEVVLPCAELEPTLAFFLDALGFRLDAIAPADAPRTALLSGHGLRLRLERSGGGAPGLLRLRCDDPARVAGGATELVAPNGTRVELVPAEPPPGLPPLVPELVLTRAGDDAHRGAGRAGMRYRDLIPGRLGGRFIGSQIGIVAGGPVPDYVHYHIVRFQLIYCLRGWVRVVYEDQGPPFELHPGDCVLQPPHIRHRVLESSPGLEVLEVSSPAEHETFADHALALPTAELRPERDFGGQRFVRHQAASARWGDWRFPGFAARDTGIAAATAKIADVRVVRPHGADATPVAQHDGELLLWFVLAGTVTWSGPTAESLAAGDCVVVPPALPHALTACSPDLELLEVRLPA
ncbi:AraC-like ligand binding domain-containing protein [Nannocystis exedens]|uniref:AraC-like ligand binding domain-containing protein n=1 Tax=Nannocystis exedens TaxID=54 RepID=A0A1I2EQR6_9BACT|nr:cupin domain-containing protein [Nannocystis exedens]PCC73862.1 cupin [Nannocystis exedens]SFE95159.1 AraC-like ligand binding domain-containing protein [Nannocystis exedens]